MSHDYHEQLVGFSPNQILHSGCTECEQRATSNDHGLSALDMNNFVRAWARAIEWNRSGLADISAAEAPLLSMLWSVQCQFERRGYPIGFPFGGVELAKASA